jgi:hypothetical protein
MGIGSARERFLAASTPAPVEADDRFDLQELIADPKKLAGLVKKAVEAMDKIKAAKGTVDNLELAKRKAEAAIDAAKAEVSRLHVEHEKACRAREEALAIAEKQQANLLAQAKFDRDAAAADRAEMHRRLVLVEQATQGAV